MPRAFSTEESDRIRQALLTAGRELLAVTGFRKTTVGQVVKRVGLSKGGFYRFFPSKEALWIEILQQAEAKLRGQLTDIAERPELSAEARLEGVLRTFFEALTEHPLLGALADPEEMAWLQRAVPKELFAEARRDDDRFFSTLFATLRNQGAIGPEASVDHFCMLPAAALALAQGSNAIGEDRFASFVTFEIEAWKSRLSRGLREHAKS